jgi:hypothetical protein
MDNNVFHVLLILILIQSNVKDVNLESRLIQIFIFVKQPHHQVILTKLTLLKHQILFMMEYLTNNIKIVMKLMFQITHK